MCIWDLQCCHSFRNCCLVCTFWLIRNFYSGEAHHVNYSKHSLNHHFQHCAHCVYDIYSIGKVFEMAVCFAHFLHIRNLNCTDSHHPSYGERCSIHHFQHCTLCLWDLRYFQSFRNSCLFCTFCCFRNFNSAGYGKRCSNHHFQHCAQCVYEIYSFFKVFEIAVCFAHFGLFEISTPVMSNMLTIANIV